MAHGNNGNRFREDESIILEQLRDGKTVRNTFPKSEVGSGWLARRMTSFPVRTVLNHFTAVALLAQL
ncbi:MAG: hypothetical protein ACM335_12645 [Deltaproteobacteria bacterium]